MRDSLRDIILDFREAELPTGIPRRVDVIPVPGKATVCIGPRRAGKSTFCSSRCGSCSTAACRATTSST